MSGSGFRSSCCSGWVQSVIQHRFILAVWPQSDISFDSPERFLPTITDDFCSTLPSLLSPLICSRLPISLAAEDAGGPVKLTRGLSSHRETDSELIRSQYTHSANYCQIHSLRPGVTVNTSVKASHWWFYITWTLSS